VNCLAVRLVAIENKTGAFRGHSQADQYEGKVPSERVFAVQDREGIKIVNVQQLNRWNRGPLMEVDNRFRSRGNLRKSENS